MPHICIELFYRRLVYNKIELSLSYSLIFFRYDLKYYFNVLILKGDFTFYEHFSFCGEVEFI